MNEFDIDFEQRDIIVKRTIFLDNLMLHDKFFVSETQNSKKIFYTLTKAPKILESDPSSICLVCEIHSMNKLKSFPHVFNIDKFLLIPGNNRKKFYEKQCFYFFEFL
jgi:hypothetical protein